MRLRGLIMAAVIMAAGIVTAGMSAVHAQTDVRSVGVNADELAWRILRDTGTADQLRRFIAESPDGPRRREAEERLRRYQWPPSSPVPQAPPAAWPAGAAQASPVQEKPSSAQTPSDPSPFPAPPPYQKVVLYEEDPASPTGFQFSGTAAWRIEPAPAAAGPESGVAIRADLDIPDRGMAVRLTLQRNDDRKVPASHTVEIAFTLSPDFSHAGIQSVPGIMVKQGETSRGIALRGVTVKVTDNIFLVGLSSKPDDTQHNVQLLKERAWLDIPVVFGDGKRALIAIDKGEAGARAFAEAFAAWERGANP